MFQLSGMIENETRPNARTEPTVLDFEAKGQKQPCTHSLEEPLQEPQNGPPGDKDP